MTGSREKEMEGDADASDRYTEVATVELFWEHQPTFGPYLRRLRETAGLSLREAADGLGLSFTRLQKLETGGRARTPEAGILKRVAALYGRETQEVYPKLIMPTGILSNIS